MRIPGIRNIGYCPASSVPDDYEIQGMAGLPVSIAGLTFTALYVLDDGQLVISDSNENNGSNQKVTLTFTCLSEFKQGRYVFLVQTVAGAKYLIGSKTAVPSVEVQDTTAAAGSANGQKVTIELTAAIAVQRVVGQESIYTAEGFVTFEDWRTIADATYAQKQHRHGTDEVDDGPSEQTQEQNNIDQGKKIKKAIKLAKAAL